MLDRFRMNAFRNTTPISLTFYVISIYTNSYVDETPITSDVGKFVMGATFDFGFEKGMKPRFDITKNAANIAKEVYGTKKPDELGPELEIDFGTVINQLVLAGKAFPGLDLAFLDYVKPLSMDEHPVIPEERNGALKLTNVISAISVLEQLVSLLHLPNSYIHPDDAKLDPEAIVDCKNIIILQDKIDFTYQTNKVRMGKVPFYEINIDSDPLDFEEVVTPDITSLLNSPISLTTSASPCTLGLFGNMGPTPEYQENKQVKPRRGCKNIMTYFSQPPFNIRSTG